MTPARSRQVLKYAWLKALRKTFYKTYATIPSPLSLKNACAVLTRTFLRTITRPAHRDIEHQRVGPHRFVTLSAGIPSTLPVWAAWEEELPTLSPLPASGRRCARRWLLGALCGVLRSLGLSQSDNLAWNHGYKRWSSYVPGGGERDRGFV